MFSGVNLVRCFECERLFNTSEIYPFFCPFCKQKEAKPEKIKDFTLKVNSVYSLPQGICVYCGNEGSITKDHVIPKSKGGRTVLPCCRRCNCLKANFYLSQFLHNIQNNIGNCAFLAENEKLKIENGILEVIALGIKN